MGPLLRPIDLELDICMKNFFDWLLGPGDPPGERRRSPRYLAVDNWASLIWREGGRTRMSPARLLNRSSVGAFIVADEVPRPEDAAWLRLEEPAPTAWVKARVARRAGARKAGLDFLEHCPYDFFTSATQETQCTSAVPYESADGHWR
jgi:hypothetical protein